VIIVLGLVKLMEAKPKTYLIGTKDDVVHEKDDEINVGDPEEIVETPASALGSDYAAEFVGASLNRLMPGADYGIDEERTIGNDYMGNMFRPKTKDIQINRETEEEMKSRLCQSMGVNLADCICEQEGNSVKCRVESHTSGTSERKMGNNYMGNMFRPMTKDIQTNRETEEEMKSRLCQSMGVNLADCICEQEGNSVKCRVESHTSGTSERKMENNYMGNMFRPETKDIQTNRETEEGMKSRLCQSMGVNLADCICENEGNSVKCRVESHTSGHAAMPQPLYTRK